MKLIPPAPINPSPAWLEAFGARMTKLVPGLHPDHALRLSRMAHPGSWLLDPTEAAELWMEAIKVAARERILRGRRGDPG